MYNDKLSLRFTYKPNEDVTNVYLAGDFNNWIPIKMNNINYMYMIDIPFYPREIEKKIIEFKYIIKDVNGNFSWRNDFTKCYLTNKEGFLNNFVDLDEILNIDSMLMLELYILDHICYNKKQIHLDELHIFPNISKSLISKIHKILY